MMTDIDLTIKIVICILAPNVGQYENKHQKFTTKSSLSCTPQNRRKLKFQVLTNVQRDPFIYIN